MLLVEGKKPLDRFPQEYSGMTVNFSQGYDSVVESGISLHFC